MATNGRPPGRIIHSEAFEAIVAAKGLLKYQVATDANISASFLADLLAHRGGASHDIVDRLANSLGVLPEALFPETCDWVSPLPNRTAKRSKVAL
jgi:hypothetical protein